MEEETEELYVEGLATHGGPGFSLEYENPEWWGQVVQPWKLPGVVVALELSLRLSPLA
jgi:hypothetical protein